MLLLQTFTFVMENTFVWNVYKFMKWIVRYGVKAKNEKAIHSKLDKNRFKKIYNQFVETMIFFRNQIDFCRHANANASMESNVCVWLKNSILSNNFDAWTPSNLISFQNDLLVGIPLFYNIGYRNNEKYFCCVFGRDWIPRMIIFQFIVI